MVRRSFVLAGVALIAAALVVVPLPLVVIEPGAALSVPGRVEVRGHPVDDVSGDLLLTTVHLGEPSALATVAAWLDDDRSVVARQQVIPPGVDDDEYLRAQRAVFAETAELAAAVGLRAAGLPAEVVGDGAQVAGVIDGSPADGQLREGDVIVAVNGRRVRTAADLTAVTARARSGDEVVLDTRRGDTERRVRVVLDEVSQLGRPGLGVAVRTIGGDIRLPFPVTVDQGRIGGPSAGLMIALAVYELADPGDLTRGRRIAGTGTIDAAGRVGPVGGVREKVAAAVDAGATVFLVPAEEADAARDAAPAGLRVVAVDSLDDAIDALEAGGAG